MTTATETTKPEVGTVSDLALFDVATSEVNLSIRLIKGIPAPTDPESRLKLYTGLVDAAKMTKVIDSRRLEITKPLRDRIDAINAYAKDNLLTPLETAIATRKKEIQAYDAEEERKRKAEIARLDAEREAARKKAEEDARVIREAAEAEQRRIAAEACAKAEADAAHLRGIEKAKAMKAAEDKAKAEAEEAAKRAAEAEAKAKIDASMERVELQNKAEDLAMQKTKGAGKRWTFRVDDITKVPHEFLEVVSSRVTSKIREGAREIPGITIYQEDSLSLR